MDESRFWATRPISGGSDLDDPSHSTAVVTDDPAASSSPEPAIPQPSPPSPDEELARLREENARLAGENRGLRESRRESVASATAPTPPADPYAAEFKAIETQYAEGRITDAERTMRLGALGAEATLARQAAEERAAAAKTRAEQARQRSGQKIATYLGKYPGLVNPTGAEMQQVQPHLRAVCDELDLPDTDERAQAIALERTFGPIDRSLSMAEHREWERRRYPVGGGGGNAVDESQPRPKAKSKGERLFDKLTEDNKRFYLETRGSKEAAIKTLEFADENLMRRMGRFVA